METLSVSCQTVSRIQLQNTTILSETRKRYSNRKTNDSYLHAVQSKFKLAIVNVHKFIISSQLLKKNVLVNCARYTRLF